MKIFHIGICVYPQPIWLAAALMRAGDYIECLPETPDNVIIDMAREFQPDLTFMQIQTPDIVAPQTVAQIPGIVINWTGDCRQPIPMWYYSMSPHCVTCFSNQADVDVFKSKTLKSEFLQIGIDTNIFKKHNEAGEGAEIVFMVNNYGGQFPLGHYRKNIGQVLKNKYHDRFKLIGNGWPHADNNLNGDQVRESKYYNNSKIAINVSNYNLNRYSSDRIFRIMGSGCFCLSHKYPGIEKDFIIGKHLDVFDSPAELTQKIDYYLANNHDRNRIAQNGYEYVQDNFSCDDMVRNAIEISKRYAV